MSIFEKVKEQVKIAEVAEYFGVKLNSRDKAHCPFHKEKTPSFSVDRKNNIFTCFGCGETGDAIAFVSKLKSIEPLEAAKLLAEIFRIDTEDEKPRAKHPAVKQKETQKPPPDTRGITEYIKSSMANVDKTDYFARRGLTAATIKKYSLGYDTERKAIVLPYSSKLTYYQTRAVETKAFYKPKTEEAGAEPLFNRDALWATKQPIFIVESPLCALSILQSGGVGVSLCGVGGANKLLKECKAKKPTGILVLCLDNDEPGQKASQDLANGLFELGVKFDVFNIAGGCKDPNELLMTDAEALARNIAIAKLHAKAKYRTDKNSFTAYELCRADIAPPNWLVEGVLPEGLAIVCAPSKTGKSWMMLQLCLEVCKGKDFLDFKTRQADCLYYALEDSKYRLKDRMDKMLGAESAPENLHLAIQADPLDSGLIKRLEEETEEYPGIKLIVIDTLQKVRGKPNRAETSYISDYREMSVLKNFADRHHVCILLVHHLRKTADENDVFNMISGSNGIMGACDTILIVSKKKRGDENATLSMTGRDIRQRDLAVHFDDTKYHWEVIGTAEEEERKRERREYENDALVRTIKSLLKKSAYGRWEGTASDLIRAIYDETGSCPADSPTGIGQKIVKYELRLYYDGIEHKQKSGRALGRKHLFWLKSKYIYQPSVFSYVGEETE